MAINRLAFRTWILAFHENELSCLSKDNTNGSKGYSCLYTSNVTQAGKP